MRIAIKAENPAQFGERKLNITHTNLNILMKTIRLKEERRKRLDKMIGMSPIEER
jgi:hypothetical protein